MTTAPVRDHDESVVLAPGEVGASIELFSGGGGLAIGMHDAGFRHLLLNEYDRRASETLRLNRAVRFDECALDPASLDDAWPLVEGDVRAISFERWLGRVDVVAGGVPCQPWSLGGVHRGYEDARNLWPEFARAVRETAPRALLAENVRGLLRPSFAEYWAYTLDTLRMPHVTKRRREEWRDHAARLAREAKAKRYNAAERYRVSFHPVNAADYGVPQVRLRVFTIGVREDLGAELKWPDATHSERALVDSKRNGSYWARHGMQRPVVAGEIPIVATDDTQPWRTLRDAIHDLPEPLGDRVEHPDYVHHYGWPGARVYAGHTPNELDRPAKTVKAGVHGVPGGETVLRRDDGSIRYMTVREVARVMTFPDWWRLAGPRGEQMRQLGNAVPVELARVAAKVLADTLAPVPRALT